MNTPRPMTTAQIPARALFLTAWIALSSTVAAQTCSGGPDGGMDATGNQCSVLAMDGSTPGSGSGASVPDYGERHGDGDSWSESAGIGIEAVSTTDPDSAADAAVQTASAPRVLRQIDAVIAP